MCCTWKSNEGERDVAPSMLEALQASDSKLEGGAGWSNVALCIVKHAPPGKQDPIFQPLSHLLV